MPRRKPASSKQRKAQLQLKRAVKRGDAPPPESENRNHTGKRRLPQSSTAGGSTSRAQESSRKLQSSFLKLSPDFLQNTRDLAAELLLERSLRADVAIIPPFETTEEVSQLTCPRRPKWRFDMSKNEVEKNEEGLFKKWLAQADATTESRKQDYLTDPALSPGGEDAELTQGSPSMPRGPSSFERNLDVWRQLWRVTEISQIVLVLLDSRCPLLHIPPSLVSYLSHPFSPPAILILTKSDIVEPRRAEAWLKFLRTQFPQWKIVQAESYAGDAAHREPGLPPVFREELVGAMKELHSEMLKDARTRTGKFKAKNVKRDVDWDAVLHAAGDSVGKVVGGPAAPRMYIGEETDEDASQIPDDSEPEFLTIGLIGQPNVGKSSLLNALFGARRVHASKTPGKTKHFQTLFWTHGVRLVDCPGLVMPSHVPLEMQVLSGILSIARVSAVPLCTYYAATFMPLERIFRLAHPSTTAPPAEDKRTWREGMEKKQCTKERADVWTAMDILVAFALKNGWFTAKAGRPDIHRAGNAILRALAEGKVRWAFWPPGTPTEDIRTEDAAYDGCGIWMPNMVEDAHVHFHDHASDSDEEASAGSEGRTGESEEGYGSESDGAEEDEEEVGREEGKLHVGFGGRFGALNLEDAVHSDSDEEEE